MPERREIDPSESKGIYPLLGTLVTPRPIAWVSSMSAEGVDNLAPHSFFQIVSTAPPIVMISSMGEKDTVRNVRATGEFVVCGSPASMIEQINLTSVEFPYGVSEFDRVGLTREPSAKVVPPRVAESPYALECRCIDIQHVGNGILVLGEVIHIAVREDMFDGPAVDVTRLDPVARLGGSQWSRLGEIVEVPRVTLEEFDALNRP